jgi:SAM-dependent methyltransferase
MRAVTKERSMAFEDVMGTVMRWATATDALAALGAELALQQPDAQAPPEIVRALQAVSAAGGITDIGELPPPQAATILGMIRLYLHGATDLVDHPDRAPGWTVTDPAILDGYGRGSAMIPMLIASAHPDLAEVSSFLDVGTGVGVLAVAAANVWPKATIVGIDPWEASLDRARTNVANAALETRITLRQQDLASLDDTDAFDCAWIPTFFLTEAALADGLPAIVQALRPGGWVALGLNKLASDPLTDATAALRWIRAGGTLLDPDTASKLLADAGFDAVHTAAPPGPAPLALVLGQRSAA